MSRSGYSDDLDQRDIAMYRGQVAASIRGKRGQAFLVEMAAAMDAMPVKELVACELVTEEGDVCAIGSVCKARGMDVSNIDPECPEDVAAAVGISRQLAAEIEWMNDEWDYKETPAERWVRMRKWIQSLIKAPVAQVS